MTLTRLLVEVERVGKLEREASAIGDWTRANKLSKALAEACDSYGNEDAMLEQANSLEKIE